MLCAQESILGESRSLKNSQYRNKEGKEEKENEFQE